jgi:hypothetical protein
MAKKGRTRAAGDGDGRSRQWTIVTFADLEAWRQRHALPKKRVADLLGVTNSTYHNWARDRAVATPTTQQKIYSLIHDGPPAEGAPRKGAGAPHDGRDGAVLHSAAAIVSAYLRVHGARYDVGALCQLIRSVTRALS